MLPQAESLTLAGPQFPHRINGDNTTLSSSWDIAGLKEKVFMVTHSSVYQNFKDRKITPEA